MDEFTNAESADKPAGGDDANATPGDESAVQRSTVKFPYGDLNDAVQVVTTLKSHFGLSCTADQLAGALKLSVNSSGFRTRVATAVSFGTVENKRGTVTLTDLGQSVADEHTRPAALVEAFLHVELYRLVYERFLNRSLPGDTGLEAELRTLGVAEKQADRARRALQRSAQSAGMFWTGRDKLVKPAVANGGGNVEPKGKPDESPGSQDQGEEQTLADDPILKGLWGKLPKAGGFPVAERERWMNALKVNLDLVYGPGEASPPKPPLRDFTPDA